MPIAPIAPIAPTPKGNHRPRTASNRLVSVNETKMKCITMQLTDDMATKVLFRMLDNYQKDGTQYLNKELRITRSQQKYVVNLYNDLLKKDTVLIRSLNEDEVEDQTLAKRRRTAERNIRSVTDTWKRDSDSDSDDEAPDLEEIED